MVMGLQEINMLLEEQRENSKSIKKQLQEMMDRGYFDFAERNIFGSGFDPEQNPLPEAKQLELKETLRKTSLRQLMKANTLTEFLAQSGTSGISGAYYLVPTKIHQQMWDSAVETDVVGQVSMAMINADQIPGSSLYVDIPNDDSLRFWEVSSGGKPPEEEMAYSRATLDFTKTYKCRFGIGYDLIEDTPFDLIEQHVRQAGREAGEKASDLALTVLKTATDGDGTVNGGTTTTGDTTVWQGDTTWDVEKCILANRVDGFDSDTMVVTKDAMLHTIMQTCGVQYNEALIHNNWIQNGWPKRLGDMDIIYSGVDTLTNSKAGNNLVTIIFDKDYAMVSGRKRWLRIENYSDPFADLKGAVITFRQDSVTYYDDSIAVITEA